VDVDNNLPMLACDKRRVRQIFYNLMSNAVKFTEEGKIAISAKQDGSDLIFTVADTGPGISKDDYEQIFQPFVQTETGIKHAGGTGLGLPISRELAVAHGGRLWVESEPGKGSTFFLMLPIKVEAPKTPKEQGNAVV
jgi:signal transduction histidine kinase